MVQRCCNQLNPAHRDYGGRGISIYALWRADFAEFLAYVGRRPSPLHSIDRYPDNNGNYEPGNVRWATRTQQNRNSRRNHLLTVDGVTMPQSELA
jgi:hypothetical protein